MDQDLRVSPGMQVLTSDGEFIGTVQAPEQDGFMLRRMNADSEPKSVPSLWIHRIDQQVHLNRSGAETLAGWKSMSFRTTEGVEPARAAAAPTRTDSSSRSWMVWLLAAIVVLAILGLLWSMYGNRLL